VEVSKPILVIPVQNANVLPALTSLSIKIRAIKIDVNNDVAIPINNVVANPLIGPEPKANKITPVNM